MTDKEYRLVKRKLDALTKKWFSPLGLRQWHEIIVLAKREVYEPAPETAGRALSSWKYHHATIYFYTPVLLDRSDEQIEYMFVHECCHLLVNEMRCWAPNDISSSHSDSAMEHEERVVTKLAEAFIWTYGAGRGTLRTPRYRKVKNEKPVS